jgi:hypothetical protein
MRLLRLVWTLGAVCAGLLAQPAQAQNAPPPPPAPGQFSFRVCNNSGLTLYFVFIYLNSVTDARSNHWLVPGQRRRVSPLVRQFSPGKVLLFCVRN